jgi:O-methyltransferase
MQRWLDRHHLGTSEARRLYFQWWNERAPRLLDLTAPRTYSAGNRLHKMLWTEGYTMLGARRARNLYRLARRVAAEGVPGALVDCGVWNGGSTALLAAGAPGRRVWAFDSFEGLPEPGEVDGEESKQFAGDCVGAPEKVREAVARVDPTAGLEIRKGWFEETFSTAAPEISDIAVLHVDGDWYDSVRLTLETFYGKVRRGGYVVIDDYGTWPGARRATGEYRARVGDQSRLIRVDHTGRFWRKRTD